MWKQLLQTRSGRIVSGIALAVLLFGGLIASLEFHGFVVDYDPTDYNELAGDTGIPRYYYLDWRDDWPDLAELRAAATTGPVLASRARTIDGVVRADPVTVIQAGLALHDQLLDDPHQPVRKGIYRRQVEWLEAEAVWLPDSIPVWPCYWTAHRYGLEGPWISAIVQGQAISLLVRAAYTLEESKYLELAGNAVRGLIGDATPMVSDLDGLLFFEEYPTVPDSRVLNGCLCAWLGLWDYARATGDSEIQSYCERVLRDIETRVPSYEYGDWTRYDQIRSRPTSPAYQEVHASLAAAMYAITKDDVWKDRSRRWRAASEGGWKRTEVFFRVLFAKIGGSFPGESAHIEPKEMPARLRTGQ